MDDSKIISLLTNNAERIKSMASGISIEQARWKPDLNSWSILEVVNHLYVEERRDFRIRLDIILHHPEQEWPPIDPEGWVIEQKYNERGLESSLENFLEERRVSLEWLDSLGQFDWDEVYQAKFGPISAGDMFCSWAAHDQLHLRQLIELHRGFTELQVKPYQIEYAGQW
jgi:hypothetical protein